MSLVKNPKTKRAGIVLTIIGSAMLPTGVYISLFPLLVAIDSTPRSETSGLAALSSSCYSVFS